MQVKLYWDRNRVIGAPDLVAGASGHIEFMGLNFTFNTLDLTRVKRPTAASLVLIIINTPSNYKAKVTITVK